MNYKDFMSNGIYINGGEDLNAYMKNPNPALVVRPAEFWEDEFLGSIDQAAQIEGDELPWQSCYEKLRLRSGEFTVWGREQLR
jgi:hypothetical protein